jgi:hypothetical protein
MLAKQTNKSSTDTGQSAANIKHSLWMLATAGQGMAGATKSIKESTQLFRFLESIAKQCVGE